MNFHNEFYKKSVWCSFWLEFSLCFLFSVKTIIFVSSQKYHRYYETNIRNLSVCYSYFFIAIC